MNEKFQISVLIYTFDYPERTERCVESLSRQRNVQLDMKLLTDKKQFKVLKNQIRQIDQENIYAVRQSGMSKQITGILRKCLYEKVLFVSSDTVFEEDAFEKMLTGMGDADGLIFNMAVVRPTIKCVSIYPGGLSCEDIITDRELVDPEEGTSFTLGEIYKQYPNMWNHVFQKRLLLEHKLSPEDTSRPAQYFLIARYHSYCSRLRLNTSLYGYREHLGQKIMPGAGFCTRHYFETGRLIRRSYKRLPLETVRLLSGDFQVTKRMALYAIKEKLQRKKQNTAGEV